MQRNILFLRRIYNKLNEENNIVLSFRSLKTFSSKIFLVHENNFHTGILCIYKTACIWKLYLDDREETNCSEPLTFIETSKVWYYWGGQI